LEPTGEDGKSYSLEAGRAYTYTVSAPYHESRTDGSFFTDKAQNISVSLTREQVTVAIEYKPEKAILTVEQGGQAVSRDSDEASGDGWQRAVYTLGKGLAYTYTLDVSKENNGKDYVSQSREFTPMEDMAIRVELKPTVYGVPYVAGNQRGGAAFTINAGGTYSILEDIPGYAKDGTITITTKQPVTLVGSGTAMASRYSNLHIVYTVPEADLTIKDVYIFSDGSVSQDVGVIEFQGEKNKLHFAGVNIIDLNANGSYLLSAVHVPQGVELEIGGLSNSDSLYLYKRGQGAAIGGNKGELSGGITITQGYIFAKASMQGALIGSGADVSNASGTPGDIVIKGGTLNLIPYARAAAIGGSAGSQGAAGGTDVYIHPEAGININVDWTGAAIGGGGYDAGNDAAGGNMYYLGGSVRTFIDYNAIDPDGDGDPSDTKWPGITEAGVNDAAITARKVNADGELVYLLKFDTGLLPGADTFSVYEGTALIYSGGLHRYSFVNESLSKDQQIGIGNTMDNWGPLDDPYLYLYLTGDDHTISVNDALFDVTWDGESGSLTAVPHGDGDGGDGGTDPGDGGGGDGDEQVGAPGSGDLDGDGYVTSLEAVLLLQYLVGGTNLTPAQVLAADMDGDGDITMVDCILLLRRSVGL
jgi:hypothetical protein